MKRGDKGNKYNIVCLSNQLWDWPMWTNKKHVMSRLAKQGHTVLFVDPPITTGFVFLKQLLGKKWNLKRLLTQVLTLDTHTVFTPLNFLPFFNMLSKLHAFRINKVLQKLKDPTRKTVLWIYHVEIAGIENYINTIEHDFLLYDCVDNYAGFPIYNTPEKKEKVNKQEQYLTRKADLVFATAPGLVEKLKKYNEHVFYTPNVGDYEKFKDINDASKPQIPCPQDIAHIAHPIIGFTGAVDEYKFDRKLFLQLVSDFPSYNFVVIGQYALKSKEASNDALGFEDFNNIHFLGSRPFDIIQNYFAHFDAFIIPFQLNDYTVGGCFPIKFHDALAAGLPTVVTDMPAYRPFENVCYVSRSYNEFSQNLRKAIEENSSEKILERKAVAKNNNWDGKVQSLLGLIETRMSIIK